MILWTCKVANGNTQQYKNAVSKRGLEKGKAGKVRLVSK